MVGRVEILPLEAGDHLTRDEFERRYEAMPDGTKAELIEGRVYMASPVKRSHGHPHASLVLWAGTYAVSTPGTEALDNATVQLDLDNEPQPDVILRINEPSAGATSLTDDDYIEGPPEFVAEISSSSASLDLHDKFQVYRRNGIREYLVWRVREQQIDWFVLRDGDYVPLTADEQGVLRSETFPGLWLDRPAMLSGDLGKVLKVLSQGLSGSDHAAFVERLSRAI